MAESPQTITHIDPEADNRLMHELTPTFERLYNEHLQITGEGQKGEWFWHEFIPFDVGQTFEPGEIWTPDALPIPEAVRSALIVGVLTEDNLPWYTTEIDRTSRGNEAFREWNGRWTAEEWKHGQALHSFLAVSRLVDPVALERDRMAQMSKGEVPHPVSAIDGIVYVTFQEVATQVAHRNSGKLTQAKVEETITSDLPQKEQTRRATIAQAALEIMTRVSRDETLHYTFYRGAVDKALKIDPSSTVKAIYRQLAEFKMPGTGIPDIHRHSVMIAKAGIYNPRIHHHQIAAPLVTERWKVDSLEGLDEEGKRAQEALMGLLGSLGEAAAKFADRHPEVEAAGQQAPDKPGTTQEK